MWDFIKQQIFPGIYAYIQNRKIIRKYNEQLNYNANISKISSSKKEYIEQAKLDLTNQLDRKKRIEDKAKSLLFIITVAITAITFSLNYLKDLFENKYQIISIIVLIISIVTLVFGVIQSLKALNIRQFNILQLEIKKESNEFSAIERLSEDEILSELIKCKQLNDLINIQLSNNVYASFTLVRNGIIIFVLFFISTLSFNYYNFESRKEDRVVIKKMINIKLNDSISTTIPYTIDFKYNLDNLKIDKK